MLRRKQQRRNGQLPWFPRCWGWLQDGLAGYGYVPGRAMLLLVAAFVTGWLVFRSHYPSPVDPAAHLVFSPALYTLDVLVPFAGLGQASDWDPHGAGLWMAVGLHAFGWLLAITVVAAITRTFSKS